MWSILEDVPCALEKNVYSAAFGWNILHISSSLGPMCHLKLCFLIDFLSRLSVYWYNWVLKFPTIMLMSMSFLVFGNNLLYVFRCSYIVCIYMYSYIFLLNLSLYHYVMSLSLVTAFDLKYILSDLSTAPPGSFHFYLHGIAFSIPSLSVCECL